MCVHVSEGSKSVEDSKKHLFKNTEFLTFHCINKAFMLL